MIEAMSAGTPVIAWRHGSAPEVINVRVSGFIVKSIDLRPSQLWIRFAP